MTEVVTLQVAKRGLLTLPKALRDMYNLKPGDEITLLDLGGVFLLSPRRSQVSAMADQIGQALLERGESLDSLLKSLREFRESDDS